VITRTEGDCLARFEVLLGQTTTHWTSPTPPWTG